MEAAFPGPIPWRDVVQWAGHHGYGADETDLLDTAIRALDAVYLEITAERRKRDSRGNPPHRGR